MLENITIFTIYMLLNLFSQMYNKSVIMFNKKELKRNDFKGQWKGNEKVEDMAIVFLINTLKLVEMRYICGCSFNKISLILWYGCSFINMNIRDSNPTTTWRPTLKHCLYFAEEIHSVYYSKIDFKVHTCIVYTFCYFLKFALCGSLYNKVSQISKTLLIMIDSMIV